MNSLTLLVYVTHVLVQIAQTALACLAGLELTPGLQLIPLLPETHAIRPQLTFHLCTAVTGMAFEFHSPCELYLGTCSEIWGFFTLLSSWF